MLIVEVISVEANPTRPMLIVEAKPPRPMLIVDAKPPRPMLIVEATIGKLIAEAIPMLQERMIHHQETMAWEFTSPLTLVALQQRCKITL